MKRNTDPKKIEEAVSSRFIERIYPSKKALEDFLKSGRRMDIYIGFDPTGPELHLGHSTNFLLLKKFQELGHKVILLVGDFTARIGDPTGKSITRRALTKEQVLENCKTYENQASKILDFNSNANPVVIKFNSQWLSKLTLEDVIKLTAHFTVNQMIQRDMFQQRIEEKKEIYINEFLYPMLQGYDSATLGVDIEVGGTDQTFNMLVGRDLVRIYKNKEKFVITTPLLINPKTGKKLMSKSEGGYIALNDSPQEMYGKVMALPDEVIISCLQLCTEMPLVEIQVMEKNLKQKQCNPRDLKIKLAKEIVSIYHGQKFALLAEKEFEKVFKDKELPTEIPGVFVREKTLNILDLLVKTKLAASKSEAKRLVLQKGVRVDGAVLDDWKAVVAIKKDLVAQVGKRKVVKVI
ncbi:MAG: tyrosine--tRNA ligase [bacterium]